MLTHGHRTLGSPTTTAAIEPRVVRKPNSRADRGQLPVQEKLSRDDFVLWKEASLNVLAAQVDLVLTRLGQMSKESSVRRDARGHAEA